MYLPFIDSFWRPHTTKALKAAEADSECGSNRYYDEGNRVSSYQIQGDSITLKSMSYRDFPTMYWPCAPYVNVKMSVEAMRKYLTPAGRVFLEEVNLAGESKLKVFAANQKFLKSAVNAVFVFGQVDSLYPISIYLKINQNEHVVSGWYYYDKYKSKIELSGTIGEGVMYLDEKMTNGLGGVITLWSDKDEHLGYFSSQYDINGTWYGPANDVTYPILMTEFLVSPL